MAIAMATPTPPRATPSTATPGSIPTTPRCMVDRIAQALTAKVSRARRRVQGQCRGAEDQARCAGGRARRATSRRSPTSPTSSSTTPCSISSAAIGLNVVGSISISPEVPPSAKRLSELRRKIVSLGAVCVFAEPAVRHAPGRQPDRGHAAPAPARSIPEGGRLEPGPDLYFTLMRKLAGALKVCLSAAA